MTTTSNRPDFILKHDVRGEDGKTIRSARIGAMWALGGNRLGRIKLDYIAVGFDGYITVWPFEKEEGGISPFLFVVSGSQWSSSL